MDLLASHWPQVGHVSRRAAQLERDEMVELFGPPEPWNGDANAHMKDAVETFLNREVCRGSIQLVEAQREIATDSPAVYHSRGLQPARDSVAHLYAGFLDVAEQLLKPHDGNRAGQ